ncbi:unnamed protein product, partial [Polarella glacialis]
ELSASLRERQAADALSARTSAPSAARPSVVVGGKASSEVGSLEKKLFERLDAESLELRQVLDAEAQSLRRGLATVAEAIHA